MKKNIVIMCGVMVLLIVGYFVATNWSETPAKPVAVIQEKISVSAEEQENCVLLSEKIRSGAFVGNFVSNLKENMVLRNNFQFNGCIVHTDNSFGNWEITDGYIATYQIFTTNDELVSRGVFGVDQQFVDLDDISEISSHIPFNKTIQIGDTRGNANGYITIRNTNPRGNPQDAEEIVLAIQFE